MVNGFDITPIRSLVEGDGACVRVLITSHAGSTPRGAGTVMLISADAEIGTIGGGALEFQAIASARKLLQSDGDWQREFSKVPLGPSLGQCCGGSVSLLLERFTSVELAALENLEGPFVRPLASGQPAQPLRVQKYMREIRSGAVSTELTTIENWVIEPLKTAEQPLWIYGAGHVGRALVTALTGLPYAITWVDSARDRFPTDIPAHADMLVAANPADAVRHAPDNARHLVLTYSHAIDLEICHRVLSQPFAALGLIGSDTKRTRFIRRLNDLGVDPARLDCPIGDRSLGKEPMAIAVGVVAELLKIQKTIIQKREITA